MKNKVMLFSPNGVFLEEINNENINFKHGILKIGNEGVIDCKNSIVFIKEKSLNESIIFKFEHLKIYVFGNFIIEEEGIYGESNNGTSYMITKIDGEFFKIYFNGKTSSNITMLRNCF